MLAQNLGWLGRWPGRRRTRLRPSPARGGLPAVGVAFWVVHAGKGGDPKSTGDLDHRGVFPAGPLVLDVPGPVIADHDLVDPIAQRLGHGRVCRLVLGGLPSRPLRARPATAATDPPAHSRTCLPTRSEGWARWVRPSAPELTSEMTQLLPRSCHASTSRRSGALSSFGASNAICSLDLMRFSGTPRRRRDPEPSGRRPSPPAGLPRAAGRGDERHPAARQPRR